MNLFTFSSYFSELCDWHPECISERHVNAMGSSAVVRCLELDPLTFDVCVVVSLECPLLSAYNVSTPDRFEERYSYMMVCAYASVLESWVEEIEDYSVEPSAVFFLVVRSIEHIERFEDSGGLYDLHHCTPNPSEGVFLHRVTGWEKESLVGLGSFVLYRRSVPGVIPTLNEGEVPFLESREFAETLVQLFGDSDSEVTVDDTADSEADAELGMGSITEIEMVELSRH